MRLRVLLIPAASLAICLNLAASSFADAGPDDDDAIALPAFNVSAERLEDFGIQVSRGVPDPARSTLLWPVRTPVITAVFPNTAASRAGLRPGDRILRADGSSAASTFFSRNKWTKLQTAKIDQVAKSPKSVGWQLEIQSPGAKDSHIAKLTVPTPSPHWGGPTWSAPEGRPPAVVSEAGPLARRAQLILDSGIWAAFSTSPTGTATELGLASTDAKDLILGYQWVLVDAENRRHRLFVTRQRGHTDIVLEVSGPGFGRLSYLTTPAGALDGFASRGGRSTAAVAPTEDTRAGFRREMEFWLNDAAKRSERWPLELARDGGGIAPVVATSVRPFGAPGSAGRGQPPAATQPRAAQFLSLPRATSFQQELLKDALAKIGADEDHWAYTETARGLEDKHVTIVRVDPSKPDAEHAVLLKIDGKAPTPAQTKTWHDQAHDTPATLGDLPPLSSVVDLDDIRVSSSDFSAIVFELPIRAGNADFPSDKFQALFRVNTTQRALEDITVKMRESITVASVVKITDAGLQARFQTLDPAYPPQPVWLKAGGSARLLFVKITRDFETSRSDFVRVKPYGETP